MISEELINQVKFEEGLRLKSYLCSEGVKTIGYGRSLASSPYFEGNLIPDEITQDQAEAILAYDLNRAATVLAAAWHGYELIQGARRDACIQMVYQLGLDGFLGFKSMRKALIMCDWREAKKQALLSKWANQTPNRAKRIAEQLLTGEYYEV